MTRFRTGTFLLTALFALAAPASAATPEKEHAAIGGGFGLYAPFESDYKLGFTIQGSLDYYFARRFAGRATAGYARSSSKSFDNPSASTGYVLASGVYNWEMEKIHPYALVGIGLYAVSPAYGGTTARVGAHAGGGVEFFLDRRTAITGEGVLHFLGSVSDQKQGFFALNAGVRYFF